MVTLQKALWINKEVRLHIKYDFYLNVRHSFVWSKNEAFYLKLRLSGYSVT